MPGTARVLVVDDEENIAYLVASALRVEGHCVEQAANGTQALEIATSRPVDVIVLDVLLPDLDGFEVMRRLRARGVTVPIIFLTALTETADRVRGLTTGGDDYLTKPFALEELVARVSLALRRTGSLREAGRLVVGELTLDEGAHRVWRGEVEVHLTPTEYSLLRCLMLNAGRVVTRAQIIDHVWDYDFSRDSSIVESFVSTLRRKVDQVQPRHIHTVRGVGYSVREPA